MYTFARIKVHPKLDLTAWYLVITREMVDLTMDMHRSAAVSLFLKFHTNPHLFNQKTWQPVNEQAELYNPVKLSAGWLATAIKGLTQFGVIYMGTAHGLLFGENVEIVETRTSEELEFPENTISETRRITISRWYGGDHFYLQCQDIPVFSRDKFDTLDEALAEARAFALDKNITVADSQHLYTKEGD